MKTMNMMASQAFAKVPPYSGSPAKVLVTAGADFNPGVDSRVEPRWKAAHVRVASGHSGLRIDHRATTPDAMTKTTGVFLALIVVGIAVTTGTHAHTHAAVPVCPATSTAGR